LAALIVGVFWGCQKEVTLDKNNNPVVATANYSLTIEEVKSYVEQFKSKQININSFSSTESTFKFPLNFNWKNFVNETSFRGRNYAIVPIEDGGFFSANKGKVDVLGSFYKDSIGQITGNLFVYIADSAYSDKVKGKFNSKDFTGELMIFDLNSKFQKGVKLVDGKPQKIINDVIVSDKKNNLGNRLQTRSCGLYNYEIYTIVDCGNTFCIEYRFFQFYVCTWDDAGGWQVSHPASNYVPGATGIVNGGLDPYITNPDNSPTYPQTPLNPAAPTDPYIGILNDLLLILTGDIDYSTFKARYGLYLTNEQVNGLNSVVQSANLQSTKQVEFLVNNIGYINAFQAISSDKLSNYLNLLKDNATYYQFNKSRNFPASAALALFKFRNFFSTDEFVDLYVNEPLFVQVADKIDKPNFMHRGGVKNANTCPETFLYIKVGDGFTTNVKDVAHGYLKNFTFLKYCIPNMCVQIRGKDKFGQPLTAEKASELSAYAMDNARLELFDDVNVLIYTSEDAKRVFKDYFKEELAKLTGYNTACSISYGECSGDRIPGEFVYMKGLITLYQCTQTRCW
jgi:hypothetical protein